MVEIASTVQAPSRFNPAARALQDQRPSAGAAQAAAARPANGGAEGGGDTGRAAIARAVGAPYLSPVLRYDQPANVVVFQYRDYQTGDVTRQIPAERVVERYRSTQGAEAEGQAAQQRPEVRIFGQPGSEPAEETRPTGQSTSGVGGSAPAQQGNPSRLGSGAVAGSDSPGLRITA
ncbi:MAG: hypothetical protein OHK0024_25100 [Thalassobaculales bacterium]